MAFREARDKIAQNKEHAEQVERKTLRNATLAEGFLEDAMAQYHDELRAKGKFADVQSHVEGQLKSARRDADKLRESLQKYASRQPEHRDKMNGLCEEACASALARYRSALALAEDMAKKPKHFAFVEEQQRLVHELDAEIKQLSADNRAAIQAGRSAGGQGKKKEQDGAGRQSGDSLKSSGSRQRPEKEPLLQSDGEQVSGGACDSCLLL